jgi:1,2-diacylglycerol 3-alpha-glucosyltransferase
LICSICFTNFGPYHLARLRALSEALAKRGDELLAIEVADQERRYPWARGERSEPFTWITLFEGRALEQIPAEECSRAMTSLLDREQPDAVGIVGYSRPESMAALRWARRNGKTTVLMSESQEIDHPRTWWKEAIKRNRVRKFSAGLVGGPRHRDYLVKLGMSPDKIAFGYNAVDNRMFSTLAETAGHDPRSRNGLPISPYFLAVNRFVPEKNLSLLIRAFARYRLDSARGMAWDLVLAGGGPGEPEVDRAIEESGVAHAIHRPGFLQSEQLAPWLAHASAFVHPSVLEPWGLVVNEAAASGLPLIVSERAGCVETLVPRTTNTSGCRFDPFDEFELTTKLAWMAGLPEDERRTLGQRAASIVGDWGPERFARGTLEAMELAGERSRREPRPAGLGARS